MTLNELKDLSFQIRATRLEQAEYEQERDKASRLRVALLRRDKEAEKQYNFEHKLGHCPRCFGLLRLNGTCDFNL